MPSEGLQVLPSGEFNVQFRSEYSQASLYKKLSLVWASKVSYVEYIDLAKPKSGAPV